MRAYPSLSSGTYNVARSCADRFNFQKPGCVLANAAPPRFEARGRLQFYCSSRWGGGAPSSALFSSPRLAARASGTPDARHPALHRGDFGPRDRASGTRTAGSSPAPARSFRPARPVPSSPCGQPPVVGADGDPTPPGTVLARHGRGRRLPRSANMTPHESAL